MRAKLGKLGENANSGVQVARCARLVLTEATLWHIGGAMLLAFLCTSDEVFNWFSNPKMPKPPYLNNQTLNIINTINT